MNKSPQDKKKKRLFFKTSYVFLTKSLWQQIQILPLAFLSFFLIATSLFVPSLTNLPRKENVDVSLLQLPKGSGAQAPKISAASAIVYDPVSSVVLYEHNADTPLPPASTTKIATALVALENYKLSDVLTFQLIEMEGQTMELVPGERLTVENLLYGLLMFSANDAAETLASNLPGARDAFVAAMNEKVRQLGLRNSHFTNPTGLFEDGHFSTARDLARLTGFAMKSPVLAKIVATPQKTISSLDGKIKHKLVNLNFLLGSVAGVLGVKTGKTDEGGEALVTFVEREGHPLIFVVLGSIDRFEDTRRLIEWAYQSHEWRQPL